VLRKKIKKEQGKQGNTSVCKPPRPNIIVLREIPNIRLTFITQLIKGLSNANIAVSQFVPPLEMELVP